MVKFSYVTANLIAQPAGFSGVSDWGELADAMTEETTPETFRLICRKVKGMGFEGIEIYGGHCNYLVHDLDHARAIRDVCGEEGLEVAGYAGSCGQPDGTRDDYERNFAMCEALGAKLLAGGFAGDANLAAEILRDHGLVIAYENHPEKTADELLKKIEGNEDVIKLCLDTGNLTAKGGDALEVAEALLPHIAHLHLKDVKAVGGHDTLAIGRGVARVKEALLYCVASGYDGWATIEHEPFDRDPDPEVAESLVTVKAWLG